MDADKLYERAINIKDRLDHGLWLPILRHLMLRGHENAMVALGHWYTEGNDRRDLDGTGEPYTAANLYYRVWRKGGDSAAHAAHSLAISYFNRGDMLRFRQWARRGARLGDYSCKFYVKNFETRLPHANARDVRRQRPEAKRDEFA